jgi:hypothetical protein
MIELWRAQHRLRPPKKERPAHFFQYSLAGEIRAGDCQSQYFLTSMHITGSVATSD